MIICCNGEALPFLISELGLKLTGTTAFGVIRCSIPPATVSVQHPIYQPTLIKAALNDFTLVMALFEGVFQPPPAQYPCGAALTEPDEFRR